MQNSAMTALSARRGAVTRFWCTIVLIHAADGDQLSIVRYHDGCSAARPRPSLAFHPTKLVAAAGSTDAVVGIYAAS